MDAKLLKTLLNYDPRTGSFVWEKSSSKKPVVGTTAGTLHPNGYIRININGRMHYAHRLAWLYVFGEWPSGHLDHRDRNPANNRIENLRLATRAQNLSNAPKRRTNVSGFKGVHPHQKKWAARIQSEGKNIYLGVFNTAEEAYKAYLAAAKKHHGEFMHP